MKKTMDLGSSSKKKTIKEYKRMRIQEAYIHTRDLKSLDPNTTFRKGDKMP